MFATSIQLVCVLGMYIYCFTQCSCFPFTEIDVNSLKSLLVPCEKCTLSLALSCQQWCAVLSGLKDVKKLKELCVYTRHFEVRTIATQTQKVMK